MSSRVNNVGESDVLEVRVRFIAENNSNSFLALAVIRLIDADIE